MRSRIAAVVILLGVFLMAGCGRYGLNEYAIPGTEGRGDGSYTIDLQMANVGNLVPNNPVRFNDVNVGTVDKLRLDGWHAVVTVALNPGVKLPQDVFAQVGQSSLLGAKFVELSSPQPNSNGPVVAAGATIPLSQTGSYPTTENTLAGVSTLLNGGGLQQIKTITTELDRALAGRAPQYRDLIGQLNTFTTSLDAQKGDILAATDSLDRLGGRLAQQDGALQGALTSIPPALSVLNAERTNLVNALTALGAFGTEFDKTVSQSDDALAENVANLEPALKGLADSGSDLTKSLDLIGTIIFPLKNFGKIFRGDFINFYLTVDLTLPTIDRSFLSGTPLAGTLGRFTQQLAQNGTLQKLAQNPVLAPLQPRLLPNGQPAPVPKPANPEQPKPDTSKPGPNFGSNNPPGDVQDGAPSLGGLLPGGGPNR